MLGYWDTGMLECWNAGIRDNAGILGCWDAGINANAGIK